MRKAEAAQHAAHGVFVDGDVEPLLGDACQISAAPTDDTVFCKVRSLLNQSFDLGHPRAGKLGRPPGCRIADEAIDAVVVEPKKGSWVTSSGVGGTDFQP